MRKAVFVAFLLIAFALVLGGHGGCWGRLAEHADESGLDVLQRSRRSAHRVQRPGPRTAGDTGASDRPASYNFKIFSLDGTFVGTLHLIRDDLYQGQPCLQTGGAYFHIAVIGYYRCEHF